MAPGPLPEATASDPLEQLPGLARASVEHGLQHGTPLPVRPEDWPEELRRKAASFVTLRRRGALRGCVGSLEPHRPLVVDVAENAYKAAFCDTRFAPLERHELGDLEVHVSVLGPLEHLDVRSEAELLARLRPGIDGLVLCEGPRRATFLPAVWESLSSPEAFLRALEEKAGLAGRPWSSKREAYRYSVRELP